MQERTPYEGNDWYRPNSGADVEETVTAALPEDPSKEQGKVKSNRRKYIFLACLCIVLIVGAIAVTAMAFAEEDGGQADYGSFEDYWEYYQQAQDSAITGVNDIDREPPNPAVELKLRSTEGPDKLSLQELYEKCLPSIVGIRTETNGQPYGWGTGVVMTSDGYLITNTHVLDGADKVEVVLSDGSVYDARLVGADAISDIGVLKIDAEGLLAAEFADSALVQVGDEAIAIGNPLGEQFSGTMTTGIISGVSRDIQHNKRTMTLLQTNAALNSGNSGGALFNAYGQVVGITNMKMMGSFTSVIEGVGFAIPTATVKEMVDSILDEGAVVGRPGLGITVLDLNGGTDAYPDGMLVDSVSAGSDAERQGLLPEDIIVEIDGEAALDIEVIRSAIARKQVGDCVTVKVWRAGEFLELEIALIDQNDF